MIDKITEGIYRIRVPLPGSPLRNLNSYFIRGAADGHDLLIDTGFRQEECARALEEGLAELGADKARLDLLATHLHSDHSGMVREFAGPDCRIYMGEVDLVAMRRKLRDRTGPSMFARFTREGFPPELNEAVQNRNPAVQNAVEAWDERFTPLTDGQRLQVGAHTLQVIVTPGHTHGHTMLWIEKEGIMFTGDHVLFDISPNITAWPDVADSLGDYLDSLRAVQKYPVRLALPGHREPGDFHARIDALLAHHDRRLNSVLDIVGAHPGLTAYDITGLMRWKIRADSWETFPVVQKHFAVGECMAHLDYLVVRGKLRRQENEDLVRYYLP